MGNRLRFLSALGFALAGCDAGPASYPPDPVPARASGDSDAGAAEAALALPESCVVAFRLQVTVSSPLERHVEVVAENRRTEPVAFELTDRCPNGLVDFTGLGEGYDYYGTCTAGACSTLNSKVAIRLVPGERRKLAETTLYLGGRDPCRKPLPSGKITLAAVAPPGTVEICSESVELDVQAAPPEVR